MRNALVGRSVDDFDVATRLKPEDAMVKLKAAGKWKEPPAPEAPAKPAAEPVPADEVSPGAE